MNPEQFYHDRQHVWQQFAQLVERGQNSLQQFSPDEVRQLGQLYRTVASDLALAQREFPQHRVTTYLNQLVAQGHAVVYRGEPLATRRLRRFLTHRFPQVFRETLPFTVVATLLLCLPALLLGLAVYADPDTARIFLPPQIQQVIPLVEQQELWVDIPVTERPYFSSVIMTNNIRVSFMAFAGGVTAGLFTIYIMVFNGLMLGGLTGLTAHHGVGWELWHFVIGHGVIELSTIFIAGGSGLMLGWAIINPGLLSRRDALLLAARKALYLILGCIPLLIIAGLIEGFISPNESIPPLVKWAVGIGSGLLMFAYLFLAGRDNADSGHASALNILD
jgi:uncharacterized membrane protein SpoIIM required for sporulation